MCFIIRPAVAVEVEIKNNIKAQESAKVGRLKSEQ